MGEMNVLVSVGPRRYGIISIDERVVKGRGARGLGWDGTGEMCS